jgi:FkbM family methyltransferase
MKRLHAAYVERFGQPQTIVEIGSRDGRDAETLRTLSGLPPTAVSVFEAHPECAKQIMRAYPEFHVYPLAVAQSVGVQSFRAYSMRLPEGTVGLSSLLPFNIPMWHVSASDAAMLAQQERESVIPVMAITGREVVALVNRPKIDLLKIDVEGMAYGVLADASRRVRAARELDRTARRPT